MHSVFLIFHVLIAIALISLILLQHGKGADMGAAFGSGASTTVFGARGSGSFLTTATAILAFLFFANSFLLDYMAGSAGGTKSVMQQTAGGTKPAGDDKDTTEVVDTQIEPVKPAAIGEENKPGQGDLPPIPGASGSGAPAAANAQKPAPAANAETTAPAVAATQAPVATPLPTDVPTPEPTATPAPTETPTLAPTPTAASGKGATKKGAAASSKHKPTKKPTKGSANKPHD